MLSTPNPKSGCIEFMSSTNDALDDALAWYRSKLGGAKETPFQGDYKGVDFTVHGTDHVLVFVLETRERASRFSTAPPARAAAALTAERGDGMPTLIDHSRRTQMRAYTIASIIAFCALSSGAARSAPVRESAGRTRTYYIAADTVTWDYVPGGRDEIEGKPYADTAFFGKAKPRL